MVIMSIYLRDAAEGAGVGAPLAPGATAGDDTYEVAAAPVVGDGAVAVITPGAAPPGNNLGASGRNLAFASNISLMAFLKHAKLYSTKPIAMLDMTKSQSMHEARYDVIR
jgi:hypothetical protein